MKPMWATGVTVGALVACLVGAFSLATSVWVVVPGDSTFGLWKQCGLRWSICVKFSIVPGKKQNQILLMHTVLHRNV